MREAGSERFLGCVHRAGQPLAVAEWVSLTSRPGEMNRSQRDRTPGARARVVKALWPLGRIKLSLSKPRDVFLSAKRALGFLVRADSL